MAIDSINVEEVNPDGTKKKIEVDKAAAGYHNYLVMFNTIVDLDFAVLRMVQAEYNNPKFINQDVMNMTTKEVKFLLINREDPNPLIICFKDKEIADSIYKEIMSTRYGDLLKESKYMAITGIFFLISVYAAMDNTHVTIVCGNKLEEDIVRRHHKSVNVKIVNELSDIDVNDYTEFIFKSKYDVYKFKQKFIEKRIMLLNYKFNVFFDDKILYCDLDLGKWLWENGYSKTAIIDTYSKEDNDYATLKLKVVKKKPKNK